MLFLTVARVGKLGKSQTLVRRRWLTRAVGSVTAEEATQIARHRGGGREKEGSRGPGSIGPLLFSLNPEPWGLLTMCFLHSGSLMHGPISWTAVQEMSVTKLGRTNFFPVVSS